MPQEAKDILKAELDFDWAAGSNVEVQDDNASGHGISRKGEKLVKNATRLELEAALLRLHIVMFNQPAQSPGYNRQDLGILHMVNSRCKRFWREVRDAATEEGKSWALFDIVQRTFWDDVLVPPMKLFNISKVKMELIKWTVEHGGVHPPKDIHFGIRKKYGTGS